MTVMGKATLVRGAAYLGAQKLTNELDSQKQLLGRTPLMLAAMCGHEAICARLVEAGASLEVRDTRKKRTAAQWAAYKGRHDLARRLAPPPQSSGAKKYQVAPAPTSNAPEMPPKEPH